MKTIPLDDCPNELIQILNRARKVRNDFGEHMPIAFFYYGPDLDKMAIVDVHELMAQGQRGKDAVEVLLVGGVLRGATAISFVAEAWAVVGGLDPHALELASEGRLSEHPRAVEILSVMFETADENYLCKATVNGNKLGPWEVGFDNNADLNNEGRFSGIFAKAEQYRKENAT